MRAATENKPSFYIEMHFSYLSEPIYFLHFKFVLPVRSTLTMCLLPKYHLPNYVLAIANILDLICIFLTGLFSTWPS